MDSRPPFDLVRAAFWLVAGIMGAYATLLLVAVIACSYRDLWLGRACEGSKLSELLATLLATAIAFAGGVMRGGGGPTNGQKP